MERSSSQPQHNAQQCVLFQQRDGATIVTVGMGHSIRSGQGEAAADDICLLDCTLMLMAIGVKAFIEVGSAGEGLLGGVVAPRSCR